MNVQVDSRQVLLRLTNWNIWWVRHCGSKRTETSFSHSEQGAQAQAHDAFDEMRITPVSIKHPIGQSVRRNLISRSTHMHHAYIRYCGRGESVIKIKLLNY